MNKSPQKICIPMFFLKEALCEEREAGSIEPASLI